MSETFFTSDHHFGHRNILKFCKRPWDTVDEMNAGLIQAWNRVINSRDNVYILGDFSLGIKINEVCDILDQLKGIKHFIRGNHDQFASKRAFSGFFQWVKDRYTLRMKDDDNQYLELFHYPIESWKNMTHGSIHLHGHTHGTLSHRNRDIVNRLDIGVDCCPDYAPIHYEDMLMNVRDKNFRLTEARLQPDHPGG
jgi:calcineurin-like phosphoesterase family protein